MTFKPVLIWTYRTIYPVQIHALAAYDLHLVRYEVEATDEAREVQWRKAWRDLTHSAKGGNPSVVVLAAPRWFFKPFALYILRTTGAAVVIPALSEGVWSGKWWQIAERQGSLRRMRWTPMRETKAA